MKGAETLPGGGPARDRRSNGWGVAARSALLLVSLLTPGETSGAALQGRLQDGMVAILTEDHQIFLLANPERGEGLLAFARRLCGDETAAREISAVNGGIQRLLAGTHYQVPYRLLRPEYQLRVIQALFARDRPEADGWHHTAVGVGALQRESLWHLAEWFTGQGQNYRFIRERNRLGGEEVERDQVVVIPASILLPAFRAALPAALAEPSHSLDYGEDQAGEYAVYRLQPGEALYSAVVVRFTGRIFASDVNALAQEIARRSGIADVTDIAVGYPVKIPFDLLLPEYLPPGHPRRQDYEESLRASAQFRNRIRALDLAGITVILDAGHGGKDVGASMSGVWESLYVYDIMLRVKHLLETSTAARVVPTTRDGEAFEIEDRDVLPFSRGHQVLTTPPYRIEDSTVGVHLRWYLANSAFRQAARADGDPQKVVFLSLHADARHPSLRGAMAYIPSARRGGGRYGKTGAVYAARREVQERPSVSFSLRERRKSEGLSRELATHLIDAFHRQNLPVQSFKPIRETVIRQNRQWVPAVLRYNVVPAKVLLEVCNLTNDEDRKLIQTRTYRQRVAEAIVEGILGYYGYGEEPGGSQVARTAK